MPSIHTTRTKRANFSFLDGLFQSSFSEEDRKKLEKKVPSPKDFSNDPKELKWQASPVEKSLSTTGTPLKAFTVGLGSLAGGVGAAALVAPSVKNMPESSTPDTISTFIVSAVLGAAGGGFLTSEIANYLQRIPFREKKKRVQIGKDSTGKPVFVEVRDSQEIFDQMRLACV